MLQINPELKLKLVYVFVSLFNTAVAINFKC